MTNKNMYSLTIVLPGPDQCRLNSAAARLARLAGIEILGQNILAPGKAADWQIRGELSRAMIENIWADIKADFCLQPAKNRKKKLLVCDMDSTLIGQECIDELAGFAGVGEYVAKITSRAMRGEIDFETALKQRVSLLKGLDLAVLQQCFYERISLNKGAKTLCKTMKNHGAICVIVSGGFTFFTSRIAKLAGFDYHHANELLHDESKLTGEVAEPILGKMAKKTALLDYSKTIGTNNMSLAIGDGANDLEMLKSAGLGIAYKAKPVVAQESMCAINHTDLTSALYFQGYKSGEFVYSSE